MSPIDLVIEMEDRGYEAPERRFVASCDGFEGEGRSQAEALGRLLHGMFEAEDDIFDYEVTFALNYVIEPEPEFTTAPEPRGRLILSRRKP